LTVADLEIPSCQNSVAAEYLPSLKATRQSTVKFGITMLNPRLAIFVDGANIDRGSEDLGCKINYTNFKSYLADGRRLMFSNYYHSDSHDPAERAFFERLKRIGYNVWLGPKTTPGGQQKQVDVKIAVDMVSYAYRKRFDLAVLASGDGDLTPAVRMLRDLGKQVEVASFWRQFSLELMRTSTKTIDLTPHVKEFTFEN
jgi:uncharacterized LabA/DUF88 family protein